MVEESVGREEVCVVLDEALPEGRRGIVRVFANSDFSATRKINSVCMQIISEELNFRMVSSWP